MKNQDDIYNLTLDYDLGFAALTSSSSHINVKSNRASTSLDVTQDATLNAGTLLIDIPSDIKGFSQEVRLASTGNENAIDWVVGVFYTNADTSSDIGRLNIYSDGVGFGFGPLLSSKGFESTAFFANAGYHLNEKLTLTLGARYFEEDQTLKIPATGEKASFDNLSPMLSLSYAVNDDASIYASAAEGFRSGGINTLKPINYEPETVRTYELGTKALLLSGRLSAEGAIFYSQYLDYQGLDTISVNGVSRGLTINPGEVDMQGVDFSLQLSVSEQFSMGLSGHYIDTEFTKVSLAKPVYKVGDPVDYTPNYSYAFNAKYDFNWSFSTAGFALLDYSEQGGSVWTNRTSSPARLESGPIRLLNAQLGVQWEMLTVRLFGRNITNERGLTIPAVFNSFSQNRPRTWGVDLTYKY